MQPAYVLLLEVCASHLEAKPDVLHKEVLLLEEALLREVMQTSNSAQICCAPQQQS